MSLGRNIVISLCALYISQETKFKLIVPGLVQHPNGVFLVSFDR